MTCKALALTLLACTITHPVLAQEPTDTAPAAAVDAFHAALKAGDEETALRLLSPEVVVFEAGEAERSRDEYSRFHLAADMEFSAATHREILDRQQGGDDAVAWVLTRTDTNGTFRGHAIGSRGVETMLLERQDGKWRIVHIHWSARTAE